jgi:hypothetical protein
MLEMTSAERRPVVDVTDLSFSSIIRAGLISSSESDMFGDEGARNEVSGIGESTPMTTPPSSVGESWKLLGTGDIILATIFFFDSFCLFDETVWLWFKKRFRREMRILDFAQQHMMCLRNCSMYTGVP